MSMKVVVAGGSGFLGKHLCAHLKQQGHKVTVVSRQPRLFPHTVTWKEVETKGLPACDVLINVSGENIFKPFFVKPFNDKYKQDIIDSRVGCNHLLNEALVKSEQKPDLFISASAAGIYCTPDNIAVDEKSPLPQNELSQKNFFVGMLKKWEDSAVLLGEKHKCRVACMRIGLVLGRDAPFFLQTKWQYFCYAGGNVGDGSQPFPWIHIDDLTGAFGHVILNQTIQGPVNVVSAASVSDCGDDYNKVLGKVLKRPTFMRTPKFVFDGVFGNERSQILFSKSVIRPTVLNDSGYQFKFNDLEKCVENLIN